jgi:hypothetical protein
MNRHNPEESGYIEVVDSSTFKLFGEKHLATPGPKAGIEKRMFFLFKRGNSKRKD